MIIRIIPFDLSKLLLNKSFFNQNREIHSTIGLCFKLNEVLNAEPPKAKKKMDPALVRAREEKKRRKLEKEIKKLEKYGRQFKPIEELRADRSLMKEIEQRKRTNSVKLTESQIYDYKLLEVDWTKYKTQQSTNESEQLKIMIKSQEKALAELKKDNKSLYEMAIQIDENLIQLKFNGPFYTPPIKSYEAPEGDYNDVTYLYDRT